MRIGACSVALLALVSTAAAAQVDVKVLSFNVWSAEGTAAGRAKLVEIIQASGADIVGIQELNSSSIASLASALGWHSYQQSGSDEQILSRYPIIQGAPNDWGARFEISPGHTAWIFNAHLAAYPYQPYDLRDGVLPKNEAAVIAAANSARGSQVTSLLNSINGSGALVSGEPVFLTGDFNEPSHLDWTQTAADATPRPYDLKVAYPASTRVSAVGFADTFRTVRPNEVTDPGYTWTPGYPPPNLAANEVHDRIDFVYHYGLNVTPVSAATVSYPDGDPSTDISVPGYNADHRAVLGVHTISELYGTTLTFSKLGVNGAAVPGDYGSRAVTSPGTAVSYQASGGGAWTFWEGGNWNLGGAAFLDSGDDQPASGTAVYDVLLAPDAGRSLRLDSFELLDWADNNGVGHSVSWQLLNGAGGVIDAGIAAVGDSSRLLIETNMQGGLNAAMKLRIRHLTGARNDLGLDNLAFLEDLAAPFTPDLNIDGLVDIFDVAIVSGAWGASAGPGVSGDVTRDGLVDIFDVAAISAAWTPAGVAVPEPATAVLSLLAACALLGRRRLATRTEEQRANCGRPRDRSG